MSAVGLRRFLPRAALGVAVVLASCGFGPSGPDLWPGTDAAGVVAVKVGDELAAERYDAARSHFSPDLSSRLTAARLQAVWHRAIVANGRLVSLGRPLSSRNAEGRTTSVIVPARFERATVDLRVSFDANAAVSGLLLVRRSPPVATPVPGPPYGDESAFDEFDVTVGTTELAVPGRFSLPTGEGPFPAVVLVGGSGPGDMDETTGPNKPLRDLAWGLASRGIVVLRYDKVTLVHGAALAARPDLTVDDEYVLPATAAVELLRAFVAEVDPARVFVLGHSQGGTVAPRIAVSSPAVAGLVILAGGTQPLLDALLRQLDYLARVQPPATPAAQAAADLLRLQARVAQDPGLSLATPRNQLPGGTTPSYWLDLRAYDPVGVANALAQPLLVLQGDRDYQVTVDDDLAGWQQGLAGRTGVTFRRYPGANHLFFDGQGPSVPSEYFRPDHPVASVVADIATWVIEHG